MIKFLYLYEKLISEYNTWKLIQFVIYSFQTFQTFVSYYQYFYIYIRIKIQHNIKKSSTNINLLVTFRNGKKLIVINNNLKFFLEKSLSCPGKTSKSYRQIQHHIFNSEKSLYVIYLCFQQHIIFVNKDFLV